MIKSLLLLTFLAIVSISQYNEIINARHECYSEREKDISLLSREVCIDQRDRLKFSKSVDCSGAESRTKVPIFICTIKTWIVKTDLVKIYTTLTDSYWSILGFVLPIMAIVIYFGKQEEKKK
jgi:hypothetical protein